MEPEYKILSLHSGGNKNALRYFGMKTKLHYGGKYRNESDLIAKREHNPKAVPFHEPSSAWFSVLANIGALIVVAGLLAFAVKFFGNSLFLHTRQIRFGLALALLSLIPHEFLHATCFRQDVYMYTNISRGMLFVHGTEDMSKKRFVFMSMLPNIVFGFIPFAMFLFNKNLIFCGVMGALCIGMGFGDYINVFNALTQMPIGAKTYVSGFHSYWYKD